MPFKIVPKGYTQWQGMKQRCYNPNYKQYHDYGGRGIKVCDRWLTSFDNFIADMCEPPKGMTLDRIDNDGNYTPENCRWASRSTQQRNQRRTRIVTIDGTDYKAVELADIAGVKIDTIVERASRGMSYDDVTHSGKHSFAPSPEHIEKMVSARIKASEKVCKNGHPRTPENTLINVHGHRSCRICNRERVRRQR